MNQITTAVRRETASGRIQRVAHRSTRLNAALKPAPLAGRAGGPTLQS